MAKIICHNKGRFNIYCTISDRFLFEKSVDDIMISFTTKDHNILDRIQRAITHGTSAIPHESLEDFLCCNRAGESEKHLSTKECINGFLS